MFDIIDSMKKTKGKTKMKVSQVAQKRALEFDKKYRTIPDLNKDLVSLRKEFTDKEDLHFKTLPSDVPVYSKGQHKEFNIIILSFVGSMEVNTELSSRFWKSIYEFMDRYDFSKEWKFPLVQFILTGYYSVPDKNYYIEYDKEYPNSASIIIGQHTTERDIIKANKEAQKLLPKEDKKGHSSAKAYSWINDPRTVDLLKETTLRYLNEEDLNHNEILIYKNSEDLQTASDEILKRRTMFKKGGANTKTGRPKFIKKISDEEYFSLIGSKKSAKKIANNLSKVRRNRKRAL